VILHGISVWTRMRGLPDPEAFLAIGAPVYRLSGRALSRVSRGLATGRGECIMKACA